MYLISNNCYLFFGLFRDKRLQGLLMGSTTIVAVFPMLYLINADVVGDALFYIIALIAGITISINGNHVILFK